MGNSTTLVEHSNARQQITDLIGEIAGSNSGHNLREKVLTVLLSGQIVRFLEDVDLIKSLLSENNQLVKALLTRAALVEHQPEPDAQMALRFH